jgi:HK97 family phage prohead protease
MNRYLKGKIQKSSSGKRFSGIASSPNRDRDGDTINQLGWDLANYQKNPIILWGHNSYAPPVGKTMNLRLEGGKLLFDFEFASTPFAQELKALVEEECLNTFSVGFMPKDFGREELGEATFETAELLEISLVSIPSNTDAVVTSRAFKSMSKSHQKMLKDAMAKAVVDHEGKDFPKLKEDYEWDESAERAKAEILDLKSMATVVDGPVGDKEAYKLLHHVARHDFPVVLDGLKSALKNIDQIAEEEREGAYNHLAEHFKEFGIDAPDYKSFQATQKLIETDETKDAPVRAVELKKQDRELLNKVANLLEPAVGSSPSGSEAIKGRKEGRDVDFPKKVMVRALQEVAKSANKRLRELKKN